MSDRDEPGTGEKISGVAKEAAGKATGQEDLEREGESQQKKAQRSDEAERHEEEAARKREEQAEQERAEREHG